MTTEQKIDKILSDVNVQNVQLAKFIAHQEQHRKEIDGHDLKIDKLQSAKDNIWGIVIAVPIFISAIGLIISIYIRH